MSIPCIHAYFDLLRFLKRLTSVWLPVVLAGGINEHNVARAVATVCPYAVDVSGGVESSPGIKDAVKIADFVAAVRAADQGVKINADDK